MDFVLNIWNNRDLRSFSKYLISTYSNVELLFITTNFIEYELRDKYPMYE